MDALNQRFSQLSTGRKKQEEYDFWYQRPPEKCSKVYYDKKIELLANCYELNYEKTRIYQYIVFMKEISRFKGKQRKKDVQRQHKSILLWEFLRQLDFDVSHFIYDDNEALYSIERHEHVSQRIQVTMDSKKVEIEVTLRPHTSFFLSFGKDDVDFISSRFMKLLLTQKVRYIANKSEKSEINFSSRFVTDRNAIMYIPKCSGDPHIEIDSRVQAWLGVYMSIRENADFNPVVNFQLVHRLFYELESPKMTLLDYLLVIIFEEPLYGEQLEEARESLKGRGMNSAQRNRVNRILANIKLKTTHAYEKGTFKEKHLTFIKLSECAAWAYEIRGKSIISYYKNAMIPIAFPDLPLAICKSGKNEYPIPMELALLHEKPQKFKNMLDCNMKMRLLKGATRDPEDHMSITEGFRDMLKLPEQRSLDFLSPFKVEMGSTLMKCQGKVLKEPMLVNKENKKIELLETVRGYKEKTLNVVSQKKLTVAVISLRGEDDRSNVISTTEIETFYKILMEACAERGMNVEEFDDGRPPSLLMFFENLNIQGVDGFEAAVIKSMNTFDALKDANQRDLLILVISQKVFDYYGYVKFICDSKHGIANQVVNYNTVLKAIKEKQQGLENKKISSVAFNIALKINGKLGGVNQELNFTENDRNTYKPNSLTMYVGIDVTHPNNEINSDLSIATVVASINRGATKYRHQIIAQNSVSTRNVNVCAKEHLNLLDGKFGYLLDQFCEENNGNLPDKIVVFRDGVSDSEMLMTAANELETLRCEVDRFCGKKMRYMYIVIQKRHGIRFYPQTSNTPPKEIDGLIIKNIDSGTVVDKKLISSYKFDFWLASHHGEIGTTRPCHYTVMYDDDKMTKDETYKMCYELSFLSARCRKPVSLPAPVHYAHLCCEKAKEIYRSMRNNRVSMEATHSMIEKMLQTNSNFPGMSFV